MRIITRVLCIGFSRNLVTIKYHKTDAALVDVFLSLYLCAGGLLSRGTLELKR